MCGKCIEGCYLAGWRNGAYSFEHMQEDPEFMGLDVMAAHGFVEIVCSPGTSIEDIKALGLNSSPMMAWAGYVYSTSSPHASIDLACYDCYLESQKAKRYSTDSEWVELNARYPIVALFLDNLTLQNIGNHSDAALLNEIESFLLAIHGNGYYTFEFVTSMFADKGVFPIVELNKQAKPCLFVEHALEIFLLTEHLLHYRPLSWALQAALSIDLTCDFDSYHMSWRRYTANRVLQNLNIDDMQTLGGTLALNTIHAVCQRNVENKPLLKALLNVVKDCKGDTYIEPKKLASQIATLLSV